MTDEATRMRLFVGGLYDGITANEVSDRFKTFGDIHAVDIKSKKDFEGNPHKTFAYIDIDTTDVKLKKCMKVYNGAKWKGRELSIQRAKDSFINRLAEERKQGKEGSQPAEVEEEEDSPANMVKRGAPPGTLIDEKRNWVVGKFGKVLPIVYIRKKDKKKVMKYDPSNFVHGMKRMDADLPNDKPVEDLTWQLEENESENCKKRKGIFPDYKPPKKTPSKEVQEYKRRLAQPDDMEVVQLSKKGSSQGASQDATNVDIVQDASKHVTGLNGQVYHSDTDSMEEDEMQGESMIRMKKVSVVQPKTGNVQAGKGKTKPSKVDYDSSGSDDTDEIKSVNKKGKDEASSNGQDYESDSSSSSDVETAQREVVPSKAQKFKKNIKSGKDAPETDEKQNVKQNTKNPKTPSSKVHTTPLTKTNVRLMNEKNNNGKQSRDNESDGSADTDELITKLKHKSLKTAHTVSSKTVRNSVPGHLQTDFSNALTYDRDISGYYSDNEDSDSGDIFDLIKSGEVNTLYTKAQTVAQKGTKREQTRNTVKGMRSTQTASISNVSPKALNSPNPKPASQNSQGKVTNNPTNKLTINTDSLSSDDDSESSSGDSISTEDNAVSKDAESDSSVEISQSSNMDSLTAASKPAAESSDEDAESSSHSPSSESSDEDSNQKKVEDKSSESESQDDSVSESESSVHDSEPVKSESLNLKKSIPKATSNESEVSTEKVLKNNANSISNKVDKVTVDKQLANEMGMKKKEKKKKDKELHHKKNDKHAKSDEQRLASVKQRQEEARSQKIAIKQALASVDKPSNKKIVFDSSDDSEGEEATNKTVESTSDSSSDEPGEETKPVSSQPVKGNKLFAEDSDSEDTSDEGEEEADDFKIRPQFEGKKGEKLMALQQRFSRDERFRLDERFAESSEEEEDSDMKQPASSTAVTESEKQKALDILKDVVGVKSLSASSQPVKKFKDMSALHYDPTKEEHQQFEIKPDPAKPAKKKKKGKDEPQRVEEPMPEVSSDRFFEVDTGLKGAFAGSGEGKEETEEGGGGFSLLSMFGGPDEGKDKKQGGEQVDETEDMPIASVFPWQQNQAYDSSDNEAEDETMDSKTASSKVETVPAKEKPSTFFFTADDPRLAESLAFFHRTEDLEVLREAWGEKRPALIDSYRMKRKRLLRKNRTLAKRINPKFKPKRR